MFKKITAAFMAVVMACSFACVEASAKYSVPSRRKPQAAQSDTSTSAVSSDAMQFVKDMGIGINLGNTFESCGDWIAQLGDVTVESYETAWGSPVITEKMIKGYADAGFKTLRVPVAWSNMMGDNYTVSTKYIAEVKKVVDWALKYDMYVIINLHYDNGWLEKFPTETDECMRRYKRIWEQVSKAFGDYDGRLIFEGQNEELGWSSVWNQYAGTKGKKESYDLVNKINQTFVDVVRASGGKNDTRYLLIPGYNTGIEPTADKLYKVPEDKANHVIISVHYYEPSTFAILTEDASWGKNQRTWGTSSDIKTLEKKMDIMKTTFADKGIPVIIGEYGCPTENKDMASVRKYLSEVCMAAYVRGMCPIVWSTPGHLYDRESCKMTDSQIAENYKEIVKMPRNG